MAYQEFLEAFAKAQNLDTVERLLGPYAQRYSFQINSRERAKEAIGILQDKLSLDWSGLRILDVGCAYGAHSIELAKAGAKVVGIDINAKWLELAVINAREEADIPFINCDASMRTARRELVGYGPFDLVIVNDVFEHIYDTCGLLDNLKHLMRPGATLFFKVPNGQATRHVLLEGHKKVFGISLLAPDYWQKFVGAPFHIYYRRFEYFKALFREFGFGNIQIINTIRDSDIESTRRHVKADVKKIKSMLKAENFKTADQFRTVKNACRYFFDEVDDDLKNMAWYDLYMKYRVTFWEGLVQSSSASAM